MHHPTDRIAHTTAFVTPVVEHWLDVPMEHSNSDRLGFVTAERLNTSVINYGLT